MKMVIGAMIPPHHWGREAPSKIENLSPKIESLRPFLQKQEKKWLE